jgi:hypothetical protein
VYGVADGARASSQCLAADTLRIDADALVSAITRARELPGAESE